jgi:acetyl-CoA carboxylase biotin carboxyl carrier protein
MTEDPAVDAVRRLLALANRYGLAELEVEEDGLRIALRAASAQAPDDLEDVEEGEPYIWVPPAWELPGQNGEAMEKSSRPETALPLHAPLNGTFYRADSPETPPYVEVGMHVDEGQTIGLIEAFKTFTEIHADRSGTVVEIVVQNGKMVSHGEVLLYIDPG